MYCIRCGAKNEETAKVCYNCGAAIVAPPAQPAVSPTPAPSDYPYPIPANPPVNYPGPTVPPAISNSYQTPGYPTPPQPPTNYPNYPQPPVLYPYGQPPDYQVAAPPAYNPAPYFHPLLMGAVNLPYSVMAEPQAYYSYVGQNGRIRLSKRVGFWPRAAAQLIDAVILLIPLFAVALFYGASQVSSIRAGGTGRASDLLAGDAGLPAWVNFLFLALSSLYFVALAVVSNGQSLGKRAMNIKVIRLDGQTPDWLTSILRHLLGYTLSSVVFFVGYLAVIGDSQKQGWHDKLARTLVVESRELEEGRDFFLTQRNP